MVMVAKDLGERSCSLCSTVELQNFGEEPLDVSNLCYKFLNSLPRVMGDLFCPDLGLRF